MNLERLDEGVREDEEGEGKNDGFQDTLANILALPIFRVGLPTSFSLLQIIPYNQIQRHFSSLILDPIKLTTIISHPTILTIT